MPNLISTYSVGGSEETRKSLDQMYVHAFKQRVDAGLPLATRPQIFADLVRAIAEQQGIR
jgi:3-methyladenine DNA glycosylase/8-oxoguanine DNA glycosylase